MSNPDPTFREYKISDYETCEALVNQAWQFDAIFQPKELADIAKYIYTQGSVVGSTYQRVVEVEGVVVGFIFGRNESQFSSMRSILFSLNVLWKLLRIRLPEDSKKKKLFNAMSCHKTNSSKVLEKGMSEIVLFVVDKIHQGLGYGKTLLSGFVENCRDSGIKTIVVETNKLEASSFYEKEGFKHKVNFDSPLHEYATKGGQACIYEYTY